ncbi:hypothetical protein [Hymenobacter negativus]|uniref:Uncharacterized protein n=1 Tax=Hymenobacter negativus TaxID=2795026 RepID=A0ABS0Q871_9BACT|nr:hypothetical protein [Hymenobacter negativus]MBH8558877.1 hypothetical protein [Hymenobacter negativus]
MKVESNYRLIQQVNGRMIYAIVILEAEAIEVLPREAGELFIEFDFPHKYNYAVHFGVEYFFERYSAGRPVNMLVTIKRVNDMLADSSSSVVAAATIMALSEAFKFEIEGFSLDKDGNGALNLPLGQGSYRSHTGHI